MKRNLKSLIGLTIGATDGEIGKVSEFYFDDETWTIRYLIVEAGGWLFGRKVLISPISLLSPDWEKEVFMVDLTMEQIKNSPSIDTERPVSRQHELDLYAYYPWGSYWGSEFHSGETRLPISMYNTILKDDDETIISGNDKNQHLRSTANVGTYAIKTADGEIGKVDSFLIDDSNWKIDFLVVDTGNWFHDKKVLVSPKWINEINWETSEVTVNVSSDHIKNSPEYLISHILDEEYEAQLFGHYDEPISNKIKS